ncbi:hypothetical protein [Pseudorhodoferax soli]|uniref:Lipoprotein n=1 Tax=Pseudorhodoferax soli TaxID=545864 RepID=A0A368XWJ5_9BURK|nr:hypothetical protein [Pseudorhodoferax soli]RCW70404.1 hypothetical protein DES41_105347 [Pseudorhodoferax soli]
MHFVPLFRPAALLALLVAPTLATATACIYRGSDASARVINRSGEISTPFPDALSAADCRRLRVASGSVVVHVLSADRSAITSRVVGADGGSLAAASSAGSGVNPGESAGLFRQVAVVLEGLQRVKTGSSRSGEGDFLLAALPSHKLAAPADDLRIVLGPAPDANLASFELLVDGKLVHRQRGASQEIRLPAASLKPGAQASWRLSYAGQQHEGRFSIEPPGALADLQTRLAQESAAGADAMTTRLQLAAGLQQEGFEWDARELLKASLTNRD